MTFDDPWLDDNSEILDRTCLVEMPPAVVQTDSDAWGLGTVTSSGTPEYQTLSCMEIPERLFIDRADGLTKAVTIGLILDDPDNVVTEAMRVNFNGLRYQIRQVIAPLQHPLKRVLLAEIDSGN